MKKAVVICRYSEIGLKKGNRAYFESKLIKNMIRCLKINEVEYDAIERPRGRILIIAKKDQDFSCLQNVFGLASYSTAEQVDKKFEAVMEKAAELAKKKGLIKGKTFRISTQRLDKNFPFTSQDVDVEVGRYIKNETGADVKLKGADVEIGLEIIQGKIYLFAGKNRCKGGLPVDSEGKAILLIERKEDILAGLMIMKRGASIIPASFDKYDLGLLEKYSSEHIGMRELHKYNELDKMIQANDAKAIIMGQTVDKIDNHGLKSTILRPLIGMTDKEISKKLKELAR